MPVLIKYVGGPLDGEFRVIQYARFIEQDVIRIQISARTSGYTHLYESLPPHNMRERQGVLELNILYFGVLNESQARALQGGSSDRQH